VQYGADASVEGNTIADNKLAGVHIDGQGSRATVRHNTITGHPASIVAEDGSVMRSHSNKVQDVPRSASKSGAATIGEALENAALSPRGMHNGSMSQGARVVGAGAHAPQSGRAVSEESKEERANMEASASSSNHSMQEDKRPDLLAAADNVHQRLKDKEAEENTRQLTPRKDTGYQAEFLKNSAFL
jgi:parallel beta-helix repeat protein